MMNEELVKKAEELVRRALDHGVDLVPGEHMILVVEKLVDRLDKYKSEAVKKPLLIL